MNETSQAQAIHWLLRQRDGDMDAAEWDAFTQWLEADAAHVDLFEAALAGDAALDPIADELAQPASQDDTQMDAANDEAELPAPANDNWIGRIVPWAMASAAAMALAFFAWPSGDPTLNSITTQPGEIQQIALSDAITMTVNGDSEVSVVEGEQSVSILRGEVAFAINSDEPSPLRVKVADLVLTDYGTVFNVTLSDSSVNIAVSEGVVAVNPDSAPIEIAAGEQIEKNLSAGTLTRSEIDPEIVATWRDGRLEFDNTPMAQALAQVERSTGHSISVAPGLANERLTGSVVMTDSDEAVANYFASFLGKTARRDGDGWIIE